MRIYLAGRYSRRGELLGYRSNLLDIGHEVTSRWLDGNHQAADDRLIQGSESTQFANEDFRDVITSDLLIHFTEPPRSQRSRGGRHVEFGIALGRMLRVWIVGPCENVFCTMEDVRQFDSWKLALAALEPAQNEYA